MRSLDSEWPYSRSDDSALECQAYFFALRLDLSFFRRSIVSSKCIQNNESPLVIDRNQPHFNAHLTRTRPIAMVDSRRAQQYLRVRKKQIDLRAYSSGYSSDMMSQYIIIVRLTKKTKTLRVHIRIYLRIWSTICQNIFQNRIYF